MRIENACREFEATWKGGGEPSIEDALGQATSGEREQLLEELLLLDIDYRRQRGQSPQVDHYRARFPGEAKFIEQIFTSPENAKSAPVESTAEAGPQGYRGVDPQRLVGTHIGPYKLLQVIGDGGMGIVYEAEQTHPVRRKVALKVIKLGMDTKEVIARFEAERQALALMNHPSIAQALDAGSTPEGRPFFVMEHVPGEPLTRFFDRHRLNVAERLRVFVQVCEAVQHAHQKGIIHRDLKPSNILVMFQDGKPFPKVIDFGVAKATNRHLTEKTLFTEVGCIIGTLEYMSPEQAEMTSLDIDTRSDIYSLGVILYEVLVGQLPFESRKLQEAGYGKLQKILREEDAPTPSKRLESTAGESNAAARCRHVELGALIRQLRGDLDWIVMKAMEKNRDRRYATTSEMAADLHRFLKHQPVLAKPPSVAYKLRKFTQRHRVGVSSWALVVIILLVAGSVSSWLSGKRLRELVASAKSNLEQNDLPAAGRDITLLEESFPTRPEVIALARDLNERQREAGSRQSEVLLEDAKREFAEFFHLRSLKEKLLGEWRKVRESSEPWIPPWERDDEIHLWHEIERAEKADEHYNRAIVAVHGALEVAPLGSPARSRVEDVLAKEYWQCFVDTEKQGSLSLSREFFLEGIKALGRPLPARTTNVVRIESSPAGAKVYCFRYQESEEHLVPLSYHPRRGLLGELKLVVDQVRDPDRTVFRPRDQLLRVNGKPVRTQGDLARAVKDVGKGQGITATVFRAGKEEDLSWTPFPEREYRQPLVPGRLVNIREQFGFTIETNHIELTDDCLLGITVPGEPLEVVVPDDGSYLFVLRKEAYLDTRWPVRVPRKLDPGKSTPVTLRRVGEVPQGFVLIPAGPIQHGGDPDALDQLPKGESELGDFFIGRYEVRLAEWLEFLNDPEILGRTSEAAKLRPLSTEVVEKLRGLSNQVIQVAPANTWQKEPLLMRGKDGRWAPPRSEFLDFPAEGISQLAALEYAHWRTKRANDGFIYRLPTDLEWEKAARGVDGRSFVWGNYPMMTYCQSRMSFLPGSVPVAQPVGSFPVDESVYGVRDMAGSLWEWTGARMTAWYMLYSIRGGGYNTVDEWNFRIGSRNGRPPRETLTYYGVRLVAEPGAQTRETEKKN